LLEITIKGLEGKVLARTADAVKIENTLNAQIQKLATKVELSTVNELKLQTKTNELKLKNES
jgi:hypothetical protein